MTAMNIQPIRRNLFMRLKRFLKAREIEFRISGSGIPTRKLHEVLSGDKLKSEIKMPIKTHLENIGFKESDSSWVWTRMRSNLISDYCWVQLLTKGAPEVYGVILHVGVQCLPINQFLSEFIDEKLDSNGPLISTLIQNIDAKSKIPSRWSFWNTAFDPEEVGDLLWHFDKYALIFMESLKEFQDLVRAVELNPSLFSLLPERSSAILMLAGRYEEALHILEVSLRHSSSLSQNKRKIISNMIEAIHDQSIQRVVDKYSIQ